MEFSRAQRKFWRLFDTWNRSDYSFGNEDTTLRWQVEERFLLSICLCWLAVILLSAGLVLLFASSAWWVK